MRPYFVPIPEDKGVHIRSAGAKGERYVYKYTGYFRNQEGKPRNRSKLIGKVSAEPGMMIPNQNYFALYPQTVPSEDGAQKNYGLSWLMLYLSRSLGLTDLLSQTFGARLSGMLTLVCCTAQMGSQLDLLPDWQEENDFPGDCGPLSSEEAGDLLASITAEERNLFFRAWGEKAMGSRCVCYAVSLDGRCSEGLPEPDRWCGPEPDDCGGLLLFCDEKSGLPVWYHPYSGGLCGRLDLALCPEYAGGADRPDVHPILDGRACRGETISALQSICGRFTVIMPCASPESRAEIARCRDRIESYANELPGAGVYCAAEEGCLYGVPGRFLVYYDPLEHTWQCADLSRDINRCREQLQRLQTCPAQEDLPYFSRYFVVTEDGSGSFTFREDPEKIEALRDKMGFFLLFTSDSAASPADLLSFCHARAADEARFAQVRCRSGLDRAGTRHADLTQGRVFVTFLACVLCGAMERSVQTLRQRRGWTLRQVFAKLSRIQITQAADGRKRLTRPLSEEQREILDAFGACGALVKELDDMEAAD